MLRPVTVLLAATLAACAASSHDRSDDDDAFRAAAISWVGAPLGDMIEAWGEPQRRLLEATPNRNGLVRWHSSGNGPGIDYAGHGHVCEVEAHTDMDGTITRIDTVSNDCDQQFAGMLDSLTRSPH